MLTVMLSEKAFWKFWMAVLIVASMVAAAGSLVMLEAKVGVITNAGTVRTSSCSSRGRKRAQGRLALPGAGRAKPARSCRSQEVDGLIVALPLRTGLQSNGGVIAPGAQTKRLGNDGPVSVLLGGWAHRPL